MLVVEDLEGIGIGCVREGLGMRNGTRVKGVAKACSLNSGGVAVFSR